MWYKVNKIRVGTQQVRPSKITETYTIPSFTAANNSDTRKYLSIYKSWYKIKKITLTWSTTNNSSRGYALYHLRVSYNNYWSSSPSKDAWFWINYWPNNTWNTSRIDSDNNGTYTQELQIPNSSIVFNWTNTTSIEMDANTYKMTINWNTYSWNRSSTSKSTIESIFSSSTVCMYARQNSWTSSNVVATVTYEPNKI